jgi:hypothetical protein
VVRWNAITHSMSIPAIPFEGLSRIRSKPKNNYQLSIPDNSIIVFSSPGRNSNRSQTTHCSRHKAVNQPTNSPSLGVPGRQLYRKESITNAHFLSPRAATCCGARPDTLCSRPPFDFNASDTRATTRQNPDDDCRG